MTELSMSWSCEWSCEGLLSGFPTQMVISTRRAQVAKILRYPGNPWWFNIGLLKFTVTYCDYVLLWDLCFRMRKRTLSRSRICTNQVRLELGGLYLSAYTAGSPQWGSSPTILGSPMLRFGSEWMRPFVCSTCLQERRRIDIVCPWVLWELNYFFFCFFSIKII